jgi:alkyl sulfatase BDS1-like metallo-beta-lactamase superfamily hydrolase
VPVFLSDEWFAAVDGRPAGTADDFTFRVDQVITGAPTGEVRYRVTVEHGTVHITRPPPPDVPDAALTLDYLTAVELAAGRTTAHDALTRGAVRFRGDPRRLQDLTTALAATR